MDWFLYDNGLCLERVKLDKVENHVTRTTGAAKSNSIQLMEFETDLLSLHKRREEKVLKYGQEYQV